MNFPPFKRVVSTKDAKNGRLFLTLECGHTADAIHYEHTIPCLTCSKAEPTKPTPLDSAK